MEITTIGIDLAKSVFALSLADARGKVIMHRQLRRAQVLEFLAPLQPCVVGLEACGGAHYWARAIGALGHTVRLMSPALVAPYRKGQKHDRNDADAILEAVTRPGMRFVAPKSIAQQDLLELHRVRTRRLKQRIALAIRSARCCTSAGSWRAAVRPDCAPQWRAPAPTTATMPATNLVRRCASCSAR